MAIDNRSATIDPRFDQLLQGLGGDGAVTPAQPVNRSIFDQPTQQQPQNSGDPFLVGNAPSFPNQPPVPLSQAVGNVPQPPTQKQQAQGILSEMGTMGVAPQTGVQPMTTFDDGGTASTTGQGREMTPEEIKAQEQIKKRIELEAAGLPTQKEQLQAQTVAEAKARIGVKAVLKSIEQETGMKPGDVGKQIGWEAGGEMTAKEALRKVNAFQKSRTMAKANDKRAARDIDEITQKAQRNEEGIAENDAARFQDIDSALDSVGADPLSEDPLRKSMTQSQSKEYDRLRSKVAGDRARDNDFKRMDKFVKDIQRKDQQKYARKQAKVEQKALADAAKKVKSDEEKTWLKNANDELDNVNKVISEQLKSRRDDRDEDLLKRMRDRRGGIMEAINGYNTTGNIGSDSTKPQSTNPDDYKVGESVTIDGANYTKLESGKWKKS